MLNTEGQVEENFNLIEELIIIDSKSIDENKILIPDNRAEIIIPFASGIKLKPVGYTRDILLNHSMGYFLMPRGKGLELKNLNEGSRCLIAKINPIYAKMISNSQTEVSNGIFKMNLDKLMADKLQIDSANDDYHSLKELMVNLLNEFDYTHEPVNTTILDSIERIKYFSGSITVKEIYSYLCVSKSKLEQHFNREIGLTPKEFCKIEKINYFIRSYNKREGKSLTELTYECGYYDQSHLIKDFRYFMDISPKQYFEKLT